MFGSSSNGRFCRPCTRCSCRGDGLGALLHGLRRWCHQTSRPFHPHHTSCYLCTVTQTHHLISFCTQSVRSVGRDRGAVWALPLATSSRLPNRTPGARRQARARRKASFRGKLKQNIRQNIRQIPIEFRIDGRFFQGPHAGFVLRLGCPDAWHVLIPRPRHHVRWRGRGSRDRLLHRRGIVRLDVPHKPRDRKSVV